MSTFLFDDVVFGPVKSRRLGVSLGINLLPTHCKLCNYDCIYCECGRNNVEKIRKSILPARREVYNALERKLTGMQQAGQLPDVITFAGNGEPTIHPAFTDIIDDTVLLRNRYAPYSKISVLSNATMLNQPDVVDALKKTDMPILKFDSAFDTTIELMNQPSKKISISRLIGQLKSFGRQCIIQSMFIRGTYHNQTVNNTTSSELDAWEQAILSIQPGQVMIYTIERDAPTNTLCKVPGDTLRKIAERIAKHGISVQVSE